MRAARPSTALLALGLLAATASADVPDVSSVLDDFVRAETPAYAWSERGQEELAGGSVLHRLSLTSQVWKGREWQHRLNVIVPPAATGERARPGHAVLLITGSGGEDQVIQLALSASSDGRAIDFRREFLEEPGERYDVTLVRTVEAGHPPAPDDEATHLLSLVPRGSTEYEEARVWIGADSHLIRRVEIHEENGSVRTIAISGIDLHAAPSPDTFSFTPPPGTRVITP